MEIKQPDWLQIQIEKKIVYGYNQNWYPTSFQKTRGCGPTVASMLLLYLNQRERKHLSYQGHNIAAITQVLEDVWSFVTPGWLLGLNSTRKFRKGVERLVEHYGLDWQCHTLSIAARTSRRASLQETVKFLEEGIASDCPIAFLNLHKGHVTAFDSWHWIVLVSLLYDENQNRYIATCYDAGCPITFDLGLWLDSSRLGGGFVYITAGTTR